MPKYEYVCKSCGERLEVVQRFTDDALTTCPECGGPLRKVYGNIGITFKGSGFYRTDNARPRSESRPEAKKDPAPDKAAGDKAADTAAAPSPAKASGTGKAKSEATAG